MRKGMTRNQHVIDAAGQPVGRVASQVATLLRGKHKPSYEPHLDEGDSVVVKNIAKILLTGNKDEQKLYRRNTGYPGGMRSIQAKTLRTTNPAQLLHAAVLGMLPANSLRPKMLKRLTIE
jgi:large subunit ribosomal protein L13